MKAVRHSFTAQTIGGNCRLSVLSLVTTGDE
jgi:hypothetical protein